MSVDSFKFISPGVFINEIDNSGRTDSDLGARGPAIIGRFDRGPSLRPVTVESFSEFIEIFGDPIPGGKGGDVWRDGNYIAPTYAAYAAQAYLRNSSPITVVRVLGEAHDEATSTGNGPAGWAVDNSHAANSSTTPASSGGAFGLFLFTSGSSQLDYNGAFLGAPLANKNSYAGYGATGDLAFNRFADRGDTGASSNTTGSLAAVWYFDQGAIELSGAFLPGVIALTGNVKDIGQDPSSGPTDGKGQHAGNALCLRSSNPSTMEFTTVLFDNSNRGKKITFNFDRDSDSYIRKVFNTNPTMLGAQVSSGNDYFLGETFDRHVRDMHGSTLHQGSLTADASLYGVIVGLQGTENWGSNQKSTQPAKSGWFIGQDLTSNTSKFDAGKQQKLFRIVGLDDGEWAARNIKVSIQDLRQATDANPYGSFSVVLRYVRDNDGAQKVIERFSNCNLNPNSTNYIAAQIGDMYQDWDLQQQRYRTYGNHPNLSKYVRVEMNADVDEALTDAALIPFGFFGPPRYKNQTFVSDGASVTADNGGQTITTVHSASSHVEDALAYTATHTIHSASGGSTELANWVGSSTTEPFKTTAIFASATTASATMVGVSVNSASYARVLFPSLPLRVSASEDGLRSNKMAHFGISTARSPSTGRFDESYLDIVRGGQGVGADSWDPSSTQEYSFIFSLDDVVGVTNVAGASLKNAIYMSGSRLRAESYTAKQGITELIKSGFTKFTAPLYGGFDGLTIKEREPLGNHIVGADLQTFKNNAAANSIKRAIDAVAEPEVVDINALVVPGVRSTIVTDHMLTVAEDRGDTLAIIDLENNGYQPSTETTDSFQARVSSNSVTTCITNLKRRSLNNSYGCAYFPWVKIRDEINGQNVWVPPSVVALGVLASTERNHAVWFAPAGFTRGGLSSGNAGLPVVGVSQRLTSQDRDDLYEQSINPIASFPAEGIVIFGQKTLMATPSALDRINVRRLMIFVKKEISRIASVLLFDQNVQSTWNRFKGQVEPFLTTLKARLGLDDFKVVLDKSTTTDDLIDRNIMYAKIFLKPTKALEFIAIDFVITNSGAAFED